MNSLHKQRGLALFITMLILPLLLTLGVLAMSNSFLGLKMIDARVLQNESNVVLNSAATEILGRVTSAETFSNATDSTTFSYGVDDGEVTADVELNNEVDCKRRVQASGNNFKCKYLQVNFTHLFGRQKKDGVKWATNVMSVGVEQPVISN